MKAHTQTGAIGSAAIGTGAAVVAGISSACCVGPALAPLLLSVLGTGGLVALSWVRPYAPWMLLGAAAMLALSFWQSYRAGACASHAAPSKVRRGIRIARTITWIATALWLVSAAYAIYGFVRE